MIGPLLVPNRAQPGQRIERLWVWVSIEPDGREGIVAATVAGMTVPLISSSRSTAEAMKDAAFRSAGVDGTSGDLVMRLDLRQFVRVVD